MPSGKSGCECPKLRPATAVTKHHQYCYQVEGNKAFEEPIGFTMATTIPREPRLLDSYGHYEDEMIKVDGKWLFYPAEDLQKRTGG